MADKLTDRAKELRKNMTPWERKLWYEFLRKYPKRFHRQKPIGPYIADFFCSSAQIVIELDGGWHFEPERIEYDRWRDAYLRGLGLEVLHFTNREIQEYFLEVCTAIDRAVQRKSLPHKEGAKAHPPKSLPPCGGGGTAKP